MSQEGQNETNTVQNDQTSSFLLENLEILVEVPVSVVKNFFGNEETAKSDQQDGLVRFSFKIGKLEDKTPAEIWKSALPILEKLSGELDKI